MICPVCQHSTDEHGLYGCNEGADAELAALRDKAAAFDALASCHNVEWDADIHTLFITSPDNELASFAAPTLAEAVRLAMEAGGER